MDYGQETVNGESEARLAYLDRFRMGKISIQQEQRDWERSGAPQAGDGRYSRDGSAAGRAAVSRAASRVNIIRFTD